eukprot:CAMPEP_0181269704 /NCGR_PEP_ID=MMETSP1097-20121128/6304_1 /TAXON_ID=35684 /ORGANISM="Pseudopedinella elastica, Strain CCMP716" /LENGTH=44 /DNA_ID= /DNA_START= /DNA_END= /DNA_ORIENTATION=
MLAEAMLAEAMLAEAMPEEACRPSPEASAARLSAVLRRMPCMRA